MAAADAERRRWARELHDETLQGLGGLRLLLSAGLRREDDAEAREAMREAVQRIEIEIENLRSIITELRPAALDELGLRAAIETLLERQRERTGLAIEGHVELAGVPTPSERLDEAVEIAIYRLVQEALTNVAKHADATNVSVAVSESGGELRIEVVDDGRGFDTASAQGGFGLAGMRERVWLAGGSLEISSAAEGTRVWARLPARRGPRGSRGAHAEPGRLERSSNAAGRAPRAAG
jgi:signal transduction histidine kinase